MEDMEHLLPAQAYQKVHLEAGNPGLPEDSHPMEDNHCLVDREGSQDKTFLFADLVNWFPQASLHC